MDSTLYIPKTIVVGFQNRNDTFTGKLAYVIYKDHTGRLRKEKSWNSWRDQKIDTIEVENVPSPNFTLNKGVKRSSEWFGSGRSMIRVWDPRDFEFEITVDNLLNVLMHADVSKRDITEPCVYAWQGQNLVLLPANSVEYQESVKHTEKQTKKVSARDLVPGRVYSIKANASTEVMYLGRMDRFEVEQHRNASGSATAAVEHKLNTKKGKAHVFIDMTTKQILVKDPSSYLAGELIDYVHADFGVMMDHYYGSIESQPVVGATITNNAFIADDELYVYRYVGNTVWFSLSDTEFVEIAIVDDNHWSLGRAGKKGNVVRFARYVPETSRIELSWYRETASYGRFDYTTGIRHRDELVIVEEGNLSGLHANDPRVIEFADRVKTLPDVKPRSGCYGPEYTIELRRQLTEHLNNAASIGAGYYLTFKLADGKIVHDYQL